MPTNKPRIFVTLDPDVFDDIRTYMEDLHFKSLSSAASFIISQYLFEFFEHQSYGVTLFDICSEPLSINVFEP